MRKIVLVLAVVITLTAAGGCAGDDAATNSTTRTTIAPPADPSEVRAVRQPLTTDPMSAVAHDTEVMALTAHAGRLFAATDQWMYGGTAPAGQILVKDDARSAWRVFEPTASYRVQALDSFAIPADQGLGAGHALLVTQAIVDGRSRIQWLRDGADGFAPADSDALPSLNADVRAFGSHEDGGTWSVYAGVEPTGILRGTWSPATRTLTFDPTPELVAAKAGRTGQRSQKVTGFADCGGALYVSINTKLYRRNDGTLGAGTPRWSLVYEAPAVGSFNSGLRGLTCVTHDGAPALLASTEGNGNVYRFDHLPHGRRTDRTPHLVPVLEFAPISAIRHLLATHGTSVPSGGAGSIGYVIAAYNNFTTTRIDGADRQLFGFEWAYAGGCPSTRTCGPTAFNAVTYDAAACFFVRTDTTDATTYTPRCLGGKDFTLARQPGKPIRAGEAFVSIRTIAVSPFGDDALYFGGYDCNFYPADGTAWIARAARAAVHGAST
jgi:hypothetical protein